MHVVLYVVGFSLCKNLKSNAFSVCLIEDVYQNDQSCINCLLQ